MKRWGVALAALCALLAAEAWGQPVQWQSVQNAINSIQSQLTTLSNKVAALSANPAGVSGQPGQIVGFGTNQQGEAETVNGDCAFTRVAANTYQITCKTLNGLPIGGTAAAGSVAGDFTVARTASIGKLWFGTSGNQSLDFGANIFGAFEFNGAPVGIGKPVLGMTTGDLSVARSASSGRIYFGSSSILGATANQFLDYGITGSGAFSFSAPTGIGTPATGMTTGDFSAARSTGTGRIWLGSNGSQYLDYGIARSDFSFIGAGLEIPNGALQLGTSSAPPFGGSLTFLGATSGSVTVNTPPAVTAYSLQWPSAQAKGATNQPLINTDDAGTLGWGAAAATPADSYGADPTDTADSSGAIQSAINAVCNARANPSGASNTSSAVQLSTGTYALLRPLILACTSTRLQLFGAGANHTLLAMKTGGALGQSYGPAIVVEPSNAISSLNAGTITGASLATGSGNSLYWATSAATFDLHLDQIVHGIAQTPLNGLAALDVRYFVKVGTLAGLNNGGVVVAASDGRMDGTGCGFQGSFGSLWNCGGAYSSAFDANGAVRFRVNVGGTLVEVHSGNAVMTTNVVHEIENVFDGANVCLFVDGTRVATTAQAGTITQRVDEDETVGYVAQYFPTSSPLHQIWYSGPSYLDSFEIRNAIPAGRTCANASYTADTAKFAGDANSLLLLNFDVLRDLTGATTTTSPALIQADRFNGTAASGNVGAWLSVRNEGLVSGNGAYIHDLATYGAGVGLYAMTGSQGNQFDNLLFLSSYYTGKFESNTGFNNESSHVKADGTVGGSSVAGFIWTNAAGITSASDYVVSTPACNWACYILGPGSSGHFNRFYMAPASTTVWSLALNDQGQSPGTWDFIAPVEDVEAGGSSGGIWFAGPGILNIHGGTIASAGTTPLITFGPNVAVNTSGAINVDGANLSMSSTAAEVVNQIGTPNVGSTDSVIFQNSLFLGVGQTLAPPASVPWSNLNALVSLVPAETAALGTITVNSTCEFGGGAPSCSATLGASNLQITLKRPMINIPVTVKLCEDATGTRTPTLIAGTGVAAIKWVGGAAPVWTTTAGKCDQVTLSYDGTNLNEVSRALNE